jgi:hypothetical protein
MRCSSMKKHRRNGKQRKKRGRNSKGVATHIFGGRKGVATHISEWKTARQFAQKLGPREVKSKLLPDIPVKHSIVDGFGKMVDLNFG